MKKIFLMFIALIYSLTSNGQEREWDYGYRNKTPAGSFIENNGEGGDCLWGRVDDRYAFKTPKEYGIAACGLSKWYFYKQTVVGIASNGYFVFFEKTSRIHQFNSKEKWENFIRDNGLKPAIWTRWYDGDWEKSNLMDFIKIIMSIFTLMAIFSRWLAIIVLLFFAILFGLLIKGIFSEMYKEKFSPKKLISKSFYTVLAVVLISIIIDQLLIAYPQSF